MKRDRIEFADDVDVSLLSLQVCEAQSNFLFQVAGGELRASVRLAIPMTQNPTALHSGNLCTGAVLNGIDHRAAFNSREPDSRIEQERLLAADLTGEIFSEARRVDRGME
jgi:hypothetical protein